MALQAFADGGVDAMAEFWDPDIDWRAAEGAIDDVGEMHGPVAVRRYIQDWIDTFDDFSVVVEELRDVGDERVLAIQRVKARAKLSGIEIDLRYAVVNTVRDGKVVRGREYLTSTRPSQPWGCRSRRCRRRTWISSSVSSQGWRALDKEALIAALPDFHRTDLRPGHRVGGRPTTRRRSRLPWPRGCARVLAAVAREL